MDTLRQTRPTNKLSTGRCRWRHVYSSSVLLLVLCLFVLLINMRELRLLQADYADQHRHLPSEGISPAVVEAMPAVGRDTRPIAWIYGKRMETGYLKHVFNVFERIGYATGEAASDWTVLWSHDYPFNMFSQQLHNLKPHQRVNHFPGSGVLTNKPSLVVSPISVIPKAFHLPDQRTAFQTYASQHKDKLWIQKGSTHRGIRIATVGDIIASVGDMIVQEYVDNPLLIDDRRFDIGLYVTLTSVNPLRVYVYQGDWLIRFCTKAYEPFDAADIDKYVISDDYSPVWDVPSIAKFYTELDTTRKEAFFAYLRSIGKDPEKLARELEEAVQEVCYAKESGLIENMMNYSPRNFFEMVRFDFVLDKNLKVYLMEVNMSPNLSSGHFAGNKLLYEQVVYSTLQLVGIATAVDTEKAKSNSEDTANMQVSSRDLRVHVDICSSSFCISGCQEQDCRLCRRCLGAEDESTYKAAYLEHVRRGTYHRIIPPSLQKQSAARNWNASDDVSFNQLRSANQKMFLWYRGKCLQESMWCL